MSGGAFRDAGAAAIERVSILEQEKVDLEAQVAKLRAELGNGSHQDASSTEREISRLKVQLAADEARKRHASWSWHVASLLPRATRSATYAPH